jgi:hypothetical protein
MENKLRTAILISACAIALPNWGGCQPSCTYNPPYGEVERGGTVEFDELNVPECPSSTCNLVIDIVNSFQVKVRTLYDGDPDALVYPVMWDTRDDEGAIVPSDVYVCRAKLNGQRVDSWTVLVTE